MVRCKCGAVVANRRVDETKQDIVVYRCNVCNRRHITFDVEPIRLTIKDASQ